jgi:hypothetical protein
VLATNWVRVLDGTPLDVMPLEAGVVTLVDELAVILGVILALVDVDEVVDLLVIVPVRLVLEVLLDVVPVGMMLLDVVLVHVADVLLVVVLVVRLTDLAVEEVTVSLVIV